MVSAIFDEALGRWKITTDRGDVISAQYCIMATGLISAPVDPKFEGLETFAGEQYMTSRWPQTEPTFAGKRVAVIGMARSIQYPEVAKDAGQLRSAADAVLHHSRKSPVDASSFKTQEDYSALKL